MVLNFIYMQRILSTIICLCLHIAFKLYFSLLCHLPKIQIVIYKVSYFHDYFELVLNEIKLIFFVNVKIVKLDNF
jgi:hypothetical protein